MTPLENTITPCICGDQNCVIPYGFCHCGCGDPTKPAKQTHKKWGWIVGKPLLYINHHRLKKHGHSPDGKSSPTYRTWDHVVQRCTNPESDNYKHYGGRGITICDRWLVFENFLADMGDRPEGKSINRIRNNEGYEKNNCHWATQAEQMNNTRSTRIVQYQGKEYTLNQLSTDHGIKPKTLRRRIDHYGMTIEQAISLPVIVGSHVRKS